MSGLTRERIRENLAKLKLPRIDQIMDSVTEEASKADLTYMDFLDRLLEEEITAKKDRALSMRTQMARFPQIKTLEQFDFSFQPSIDQRQIKELATLRFVENGENVIFLGPPGVGKTHLAISLGVRAVAQGYTTYFITVPDLLEGLESTQANNRAFEKMKPLYRARLLIVDEMGYLPLGHAGARFFFQLVSHRYEKGAIILTSNKSYGEWGSIFEDNVIASAILDRLLHHSTTINIRGESFRLRHKKKAGLLSKHQQDSEPIISGGEFYSGENGE